MIDMTRWDMAEDADYWVGSFTVEAEKIPPIGMTRYCYPGTMIRLYVNVVPSAKFSWELAVDCLLDFMDRLRTGRLPQGMDDPDALMDLCVSAARRQR